MEQGLRIVGSALIVGIAAALTCGRSIESVLNGVRGDDPATLLLAFLVLGATAAIACLIPARRAGRINPITALWQ